MVDTNLKQHFRKDIEVLKCSYDLCDHVFPSRAALVEHLWVHKIPSSGRIVEVKNREQRCPYPRCGNRFYGEHIDSHIKTHTQANKLACPHLNSWEDNDRQLCGFRADNQRELMAHRVEEHSFNVGARTAAHPWVVCADIPLSEAPIYFSMDAEENDHNGDGQEQHAHYAYPLPGLGAPHAYGPPPHDAHYQGAPANGPPLVGGPHAQGRLVLMRVDVVRTIDPFGRIVRQIERRVFL